MTAFFKLSGGGNDFLALVEPESEPAAATVRAWCSRGLSVGADGLFILRRADRAVRMVHFNADGARAELCINGARCAALLAFELGWAAERVEIATDAGQIFAESAGSDRVTLELPGPIPRPERLDLPIDGEVRAGWSVEVGVPHFVLVWSGSLAVAPVDELGPKIRSHAAFPAGANVDFVRFGAPDQLGIRTFERGVEAETLACGTGVLAAVAAGLASGALSLPVKALTAGGAVFEVGAADGGWTLAGDARIVAEGELRAGASALPARRSWTSE